MKENNSLVKRGVWKDDALRWCLDEWWKRNNL